MPVTVPKNLRGTKALRQHYGKKHVVIVCKEDPSEFEAARDRLAAVNGALVVETEPGPLADKLGWPSVTACDRYLDVGMHGDGADVDHVIDALRGFDMRCEECPQAADEVGNPWLDARQIGS